MQSRVGNGRLDWSDCSCDSLRWVERELEVQEVNSERASERAGLATAITCSDSDILEYSHTLSLCSTRVYSVQRLVRLAAFVQLLPPL